MRLSDLIKRLLLSMRTPIWAGGFACTFLQCKKMTLGNNAHIQKKSFDRRLLDPIVYIIEYALHILHFRVLFCTAKNYVSNKHTQTLYYINIV
uniref:Uncharacterized protein n=1 Tax=Lymantria dispar multicapsid nuclear polyhedrosis virus TaxID=10449 RepID=A0A1B1MQL0_NPVLD|nr:hypothetical protein [Lymantria dispar multiple nucleopolyhedrovirus]